MINEFEYKNLNTKELCIDVLYQRDIDRQRVRKIADNWNDVLVNPIKVSYRDGKYWVFDGQHTMAAFKVRNKGRDCSVPCRVHYGLTWMDEAELFLQQFGESRAVKMNDKFKTMFNMGHTDVVRMVKIAESIGVIVDFKGTQSYMHVNCLSTLYKAVTRFTDKEYLDMLEIIVAAWDGMPESFSAEIIKGLSMFMTVYKGEYKKDKLIVSLKKVRPRTIIAEGKISIATGDTKYARQIAFIYNKGRTSGRLDERM